MMIGGQPSDEEEARRVHDAIMVMAVKDRLLRALGKPPT